MGWVSRRVGVTHPDFGKVFPCRCQNLDTERVSRIAALERYSNLGPLRHCTFAASNAESFIVATSDRATFDRALTAAEEYADDPDGWISFAGPSGSGKTWLAAAIANRQIELGRVVLFVTAADLLDYLRGGFDDDAELSVVDLFDQVRGAHLLVLDDLPTRPASPWGQERLMQLLAYRHVSRLPTVVTLRGDVERLDEFLRTRLDSGEGFARLYNLRRTGNTAGSRFGAIPAGMRQRMTFGTFNPKGWGQLDAEKEHSLSFAFDSMRLQWSQNPTEWRLLDGPAGVGKTHLAVAAAAEREFLGDVVFFATVSDLLDHLRAAFAPDNPVMPDDLLEHIKTVDLLVLDDFGAERSTPFAEDKLFQIINYRYEERLPTIITTSLDFGDIADSRPRIASRLADRDVVIRLPMNAPDYRQGGARR